MDDRIARLNAQLDESIGRIKAVERQIRSMRRFRAIGDIVIVAGLLSLFLFGKANEFAACLSLLVLTAGAIDWIIALIWQAALNSRMEKEEDRAVYLTAKLYDIEHPEDEG